MDSKMIVVEEVIATAWIPLSSKQAASMSFKACQGFGAHAYQINRIFIIITLW